MSCPVLCRCNAKELGVVVPSGSALYHPTVVVDTLFRRHLIGIQLPMQLTALTRYIATQLRIYTIRYARTPAPGWKKLSRETSDTRELTTTKTHELYPIKKKKNQ